MTHCAPVLFVFVHALLLSLRRAYSLTDIFLDREGKGVVEEATLTAKGLLLTTRGIFVSAPK